MLHAPLTFIGPAEIIVARYRMQVEMDIFGKISEIKRSGGCCVLITAVKKEGEGPLNAGGKMIVEGGGALFGTVGGGPLEHLAVETAKRLIGERGYLLETYSLQEGKVMEDAQTIPMVCGGRVTLFYEYISGGDPVYIFGGGHVGAALGRLLNTMSFFTHVVESRTDVYETIDFAGRKYNMGFGEFVEKTDIPCDSFIVICTPSHKFDYDVVSSFLKKGKLPRYVGMLASRTKLRGFMEKIRADFGVEADLADLYSPAGLDTGGGSPEEIAVSIAAEILAVKYEKSGNKHMRSIGK